ncbi:MAG: phosphate ABC transporter permease subunit PstC [Calditrichaeota bacterium]|nr:phosphate ABC transporter permease subunit PstC [Calditrichota bacterium]
MNKPGLESLARKERYWANDIAGLVIRTVAFASLAMIFLIFYFVFRETRSLLAREEHISAEAMGAMESYGNTEDLETDLQAFRASEERPKSDSSHRSMLRNLAGRFWQPVSDDPKYGLMPLFVGSFKVTLIALLFGGPIGILAALYTAAFAPKWSKELLKPAIEILAGIPSVVIGFFALTVMASALQTMLGYPFRLNAFVGGLALSLAVIPLVFTITEEALIAVPRVLTDGSLALGASKWQTTLYVVFPAATPAILAALILGFGRAFGETMIVLMATGNAALLSLNPVEPVRTMSATIGAEMAEVVFGEVHYGVLFLIGSLLFVFTFALNGVVEFYVRRRLIKRLTGR